MTNVRRLYETLKASGLNVSLWRGCRVYINGLGKDITAYFDYPDGGSMDEADNEDVLWCARLRVFSNANQTHQWRVNRAKQVKHYIMLTIREAGLVDVVCADWREVVL